MAREIDYRWRCIADVENRAGIPIGFLLSSGDVQIGKTKVFLRAGQMAELDARKAQKLSNAAKIIQIQIRTHIARRCYIALRKSVVVWQSFCRVFNRK
ncbi:AAA+ ATPase domain-containing protein [Artemisia annua]|uniref:AAA+ ATPase domain-containing protein n=1 Tax=Artemisia annua TaxID=35608 RepID=A0A2U1PT62_ARTAN|nr:AAA+ ATPase domain-containing protein [Artemisia annua]